MLDIKEIKNSRRFPPDGLLSEETGRHILEVLCDIRDLLSKKP